MSALEIYLCGVSAAFLLSMTMLIGRVFILKAKVDMLERLNMDAYQRITNLHAENIRMKGKL